MTLIILTRSSDPGPKFDDLLYPFASVAIVGSDEGFFASGAGGRRNVRLYAVSDASGTSAVLADAVGWSEGAGKRRSRMHHSVREKKI